MDAGTRMDAGPVSGSSGSSGQLSNLFTNLFTNLFSGLFTILAGFCPEMLMLVFWPALRPASRLFPDLLSNLFSGSVCLSEYTGADCCPVFVPNKSSHFFGCGKKIMIGI